MSEYFHSVTLDKDKCKGCINCIKRCPTKAIRVHEGKAHILSDLCIDCGECIRICPHHAKVAIYDPLSIIENWKHPVALVPPSFYGQFNNLSSPAIVNDALLAIGFAEVYEVGRAAEMVSAATRKVLDENKSGKPVISSACPAVERLIRVRYPELIEQVLPLVAPVELAAYQARLRAAAAGVAPEDVGVIFLTPCPAKMTIIRAPMGIKESRIDTAVAVKDVYKAILPKMSGAHSDETPQSGQLGFGWGESGGEVCGLRTTEAYIAADGIENVIQVLENVEDERYSDLEFIELNACPGGCVGGVLQVENPYIAKAKLRKLMGTMPPTLNELAGDIPDYMIWDMSLEYEPVFQLGTTPQESFKMYAEIEEINQKLPGLDCGSCGAPTCITFAEDVARGRAAVGDCVVLMRQRMEAVLNAIGLDSNGKIQ